MCFVEHSLFLCVRTKGDSLIRYENWGYYHKQGDLTGTIAQCLCSVAGHKVKQFFFNTEII